MTITLKEKRIDNFVVELNVSKDGVYEVFVGEVVDVPSFKVNYCYTKARKYFKIVDSAIKYFNYKTKRIEKECKQ